METTPAAGTPSEYPELSPLECRVLGVLIEKAKTTPNLYPLSLNAVTTGCNQRSNRDPVMNLDEDEVEDVLMSLRDKGLVMRITGAGRVDKWRHNVYDAWALDKVEMAVLAELLLRGGQTLGELRARASRMEPVPDLANLRECLDRLVEKGLAVWLTPPNQRGAKVTHRFAKPDGTAPIATGQAPAAATASEAPSTSPDNGRIAALEAKVAALSEKVDSLAAAVENLLAGRSGQQQQLSGS